MPGKKKEYLENKMRYESYIPSCSKIIGKTIKEIEEKYKLKIFGWYTENIIGKLRKPSPNHVFKIFQGICLEGKIENVDGFCEELILP